MGAVYKAKQVSFDPPRVVALKVLFKHIAANPKLVERLRREGLAMGALAHPNLVVVLSPDLKVAGYVHGVMYEGDALRQALEEASRSASLVTRFRPLILLVVAIGVSAVAWALYATRRPKTHPA